MLVMQTEIRSGLKDIAKRESLIENLRRKQLIKKHLESGRTLEELEGVINEGGPNKSSDFAEKGRLEVVDPELIELLEKRRRKNINSNISESELLLQDVHYRPVVMLFFIGIIFLITGYFSYTPSLSNNGSIANAMLLIAAIFSVMLISASQSPLHNKEVELPVFERGTGCVTLMVD